MLEIRLARPEDARGLAAFSEKTFRDTFAKDNTASDMDIYCTETFGEARQLSEILDTQRRVVLGFDGADLAGYYILRAGKPDSAVKGPRPIELQRFYIDSPWHGKRVAHELLGDALERAQREGFATFWLGVWERNFRAQAFYKKWQFSEVGSHPFVLGTDKQVDLVYSRSI